MTAPALATTATVPADGAPSLPAGVVHNRRAGWVGGALVGGFALLAVVAPLISPYRTGALDGQPLEAPSRAHLLGTNSVGQDVVSQLLSGARASLFVAVVAGVGTLVLGALVGLVSAWMGGRTDAVLMRVVDVFLAMPRLPLLIVAGAYASRSLAAVAAVIAAAFWPQTARVVRSQVLSLRSRSYVEAATGFGAGSVHVLRRHVVPALGLILVAELVGASARAVVLEAGLAFLGLGDPSTASWGSMIRDALAFRSLFYTDAWKWWLLPPVACVTLLLLGITFLGVAWEQRVNPRLARHGGDPG